MIPSKRQLAILHALATRKGRDETGLFLAEGVRLGEELLDAHVPVESVVVSEGQTGERLQRLIERFTAARVPVYTAPERDFARISDTVTSQGVVAAARWTDTPVDALRPGPRAVVVALDAVADPGNVGAIIRTAAWFGAGGLLLGRGCADLLNPKTVRATMGALFHLPLCRDVDLPTAIARLKADRFTVTLAAMDGSPEWRGWASGPRVLLVLGSEARGAHPDIAALADRRITIPRRGHGESLNVAITAGILLAASEQAPTATSG